MLLSKYVNIVPIEKEPGTHVILNALSGAVDILEPGEAESIIAFRAQNKSLPENLEKELLQRGYLFRSEADENALLQKKYGEFTVLENESEIQFLLSMTYSCNMQCSYCYQKHFDTNSQYITREGIDNFFVMANEIISRYPNKGYYVTLFGGEPFLGGNNNREIFHYLVSRCRVAGIKISVVTNGVELLAYSDLLDKKDIKEIQVTLDGTAAIHDKRRPVKNSGSSFDRIIAGMKMLSEKSIPINLRVVLDKENMSDLPELTRYLENQGFFNLPKNLFKTQIGRSYNLYSDMDNQNTYSYFELHSEYVKLIEKNPILKKFYEPNFKGIKSLVKNGRLPFPLFDGCPAYKSEWAFDAMGNIYGCTASCGDKKYLTGKVREGAVKLDNETIEDWRSRSILSIEKCKTCEYAFFCGGGCGVMSLEHSGGLHQPDCKDIEKIIKLGINYYFDDIKKLTENSSECAALI